MTIPLLEAKLEINTQVLNMLDYFKQETSVPPMLVCLHTSLFCLSNIKGYYLNSGKEPPAELEEFLSVGYAKLLEDLDYEITNQYILLNTEGTA